MAKDTAAAAQKCTSCGKEVTYNQGNFACDEQPGNHILPSKKYYDLGAKHVQSVRDRRLYAPFVILVPRYMGRDAVTGAAVSTNGLSVQFAPGGQYETSDAQEQYYLDRKGYLSGEEGYKLWQKVYLTQEQQKNLLEDQLKDLQRLRQEGENSLLEQQKRTRAS